ncbi:trimeric intracellular cation channel family protein [Flavihumibacter sp. UBA7668]|uniref:trimeric intracellular cation channel family protein n=1 Tax=Flavihumibacter sp. UBA7668 TaxID=1946542 RepID=UPI0025C30559|nr:trimeric intracellular cation channel family protein [Flavihumibacter sp. UBA7668]
MEFNFLTVIDLLGTFSFAVSGAFAAMEKKLDPFGVIILAFIPSIGGGSIRDILIGDLPVAWLSNNGTIGVILFAAVATLLFASKLKKMERVLTIFDALGLGLFTMVGIEKGLMWGYPPGICISLGVITGCFGGVIRDVVLNNVPYLFRKEIYASAAIVGGIVFFLLKSTSLSIELINILCILLIFSIRMMSLMFRWKLPMREVKGER